MMGMTKQIQTAKICRGRCQRPWEANGFPYSSVLRLRSIIRHSSFVILSIVLMLAIVACPGRRITKANVDQVAEGMSKKQVESILGTPSDIDQKDFVIMKKTTYVYRQGNDSVTIVFKDDKVAEKQSTLSD